MNFIEGGIRKIGKRTGLSGITRLRQKLKPQNLPPVNDAPPFGQKVDRMHSGILDQRTSPCMDETRLRMVGLGV